MAKIDLELVKRILKRASLDQNKFSEIIGELQSAVQEEEEEVDKPAPIKKQFVVLVADSEGVLKDKELVGWVLQMPEEEAMQSIGDKVAKVAKAFNLSKKGRRFPVETVGETCENVPAKIFKEQKLWLKTKEPVLLVATDNHLDLDNVSLDQDRIKEDEFSEF